MNPVLKNVLTFIFFVAFFSYVTEAKATTVINFPAHVKCMIKHGTYCVVARR